MLIPFKGESYSKEGGISGKDTEFARWLTREKGVAVIPISVFVDEEYDYKFY